MNLLGRYEIEGRLGEGAMADVFRARDPEIGRTVAIKVLKPDFRRDPALSQRFLREARAAGALSHPNIATIYDVGEADGVPYIAMELIDGQPLDTLLAAHGRLPFERVLLLGAQLAAALGYAHARGVVHRDVKPSNILIARDGSCATLLDFGVASVAEAESNAALARTQAGTLIGTPRYMSPEQALGLPVDARSDLFSLGAVLYEMVTGAVAFDGTGLATLALKIAQADVEPIERRVRDCPPGLRFIITKLLTKKPDARFADGDALAAALQREAATSTEDAAPRRGLSMRIKLPLALGSLTAIALALSIFGTLTSQRHALERMANSSGETIATFVAKNAGVLVADNAGLPSAQQDWAPLQAFVAAARDGTVSAIVVADTAGTIRAASDPALIGKRHRTSSAAGATDTAGGLRFVRPIRYAGANFGAVDVIVSRAPLDAALDNARDLLLTLAGLVTAVVLLAGYLSASLVVRPLRRLGEALDAAAENGFALRLSHRRGDEIGAAFDAFNRTAAALEPRLQPHAATAAPALDATCIAPAPRLAA